jgi:16S rRNA (cytosine967-C5)-methyltransferase
MALSVLNALNDSNATPDHLLAQAFEKDPPPARRDRALANELVHGVLRWRGRLDWTIQHLSNKPVHRIDPLVLDIVRLGLYQILFLSRIPVSAAVNESVELAKAKAPVWVVGFVNALLRSAVREARHIPLPDDANDPIASMAVRESHPPWMVKRWVERMGVEETRRLCKANNQIPPVTVRANTLKASRQRLESSLAGYAKKIRLTRFAPDGLSLRGLKIAVAEMPAFQDGWFQVQDEAAQIVTYLLDPRPGEAVLDACAGLGGKTGHIAQLMKDSGKIMAADHQAWKLSELRASMARLGISCVTTWHHDLATCIPDNLFGTFDRVLVDAPCSGLGVLRRNPDIKWKKSKGDVKRLQGKQQRFMDCVAPLVKRGGLLVYCVCSLEPEEGEKVAEDFLIKHDNFVIDRTPTGLSDVDQLLVDSSGFFKTLPHEHKMDGFFAARLKKIAA